MFPFPPIDLDVCIGYCAPKDDNNNEIEKLRRELAIANQQSKAIQKKLTEDIRNLSNIMKRASARHASEMRQLREEMKVLEREKTALQNQIKGLLEKLALRDKQISELITSQKKTQEEMMNIILRNQPIPRQQSNGPNRRSPEKARFEVMADSGLEETFEDFADGADPTGERLHQLVGDQQKVILKKFSVTSGRNRKQMFGNLPRLASPNQHLLA